MATAGRTKTGGDQQLGQEALWQALARDLNSGKLPSAWLLYGPAGAGVSRVGQELAHSLLCLQPTPLACGLCSACHKLAHKSHPDLTELLPQGLYLTLEQSKAAAGTALLTPSEGERRVLLLHQIEQMTPEAANALLKIVEEPPPWSYFVLCTENEGKVLPTIISRCRRYSVRPLALTALARYLTEEFQLVEEEALRLAELAEGRLELARELASSGYAERLGELTGLLRQAWTNPGPTFAFEATQQLLALAEREREQLLDWLKLLLGLLRGCWLRAEGVSGLGTSDLNLPVTAEQLPPVDRLRQLVELTLVLLAQLQGNLNLDLALGNYWEAVARSATEDIAVPVLE